MDDPVLPSGTPLLESTLDKSLSTSQANLTRFLQTHLLRKWSLDACAACFSTSRSSSSTLQKIFRLFWPTFGWDKKICTSFLVGIYLSVTKIMDGVFLPIFFFFQISETLAMPPGFDLGLTTIKPLLSVNMVA